MKGALHTPFSVAAYIRLSREDGDKAESDSIGNQRKLIADFLKGKEEFILYEIYVDDGFSGTNFERPAFRRMIADIEAGKVNCVIVKDLSRFGRDYIDTGKYLERYFPDNNVRFISITDNIDSEKQAYDMLLPIKNIFNEQYARDISKKIHAAVQTKQKAGEFIGAFAAYGYRKSEADKNKLIIDEYAAEVVRRIFALYVKGYGKMRIAGVLNEEGIVCPSEYKRLNGENYRNSNRLESTYYWTYSTINRILQNEIYIGNMVQGKKFQQMRSPARLKDRADWIVVPGTHEAIIDRETWEKAQDLLKRRTRKQHLEADVSIFAGFLRCGDCGKALVKKRGTVGHGEGIVNYYCGGYVHSGRKFCTPHGIAHSTLEQIVTEDLRTVIRSVDDLKEIVKTQESLLIADRREGTVKALESQMAKVQAEIEKVRRLKKAVYEDYREELISREDFVAYREDYVKKEVLLRKQLEGLEEKADREGMADVFETPWISHLLKLGEVEYLDREIVVEMLHEIRVYENHRIVIVYNFSDELEGLF
ncbi:MAG: recombinase family protein [Lachnospiraceae bacterium]|nr:recombinase family protein [Lachnospiraceae bacterium]